jgi:hypothetical protein
MNILIDLHYDVLIAVLGEWIAPKDICVFDSSCCNKIIRPLYLHLLSSKPFSFGYLSEQEVSYDWISLRSVKLRCIFVREKDIFQTDGLDLQQVVKLDIGQDVANTQTNTVRLVRLLNGCSSLTSLCVGNTSVFTDGLILQMATPVLNRLLELRVYLFEHSIGIQSYSHLIKHTHNVVVLLILSKNCYLVDDNLVQVVVQKKQLLKCVMISVIEPNTSISNNEYVSNQIRTSRALLVKLKLRQDCLNSMLWYVSDSRKCMIGFDSRSSQVSSNSNRIGDWIYHIDCVGKKYALFRELHNGKFSTIANMQMFFTCYDGFTAINVAGPMLDDSILTLIASKDTNKINLLTLTIHKSLLVRKVPRVTVEGLTRITTECISLQRVELHNFLDFTATNYITIFQHAYSLRQIQITCLDDKQSMFNTALKILDSVHHIEYIRMVWTRTEQQVSDSDLQVESLQQSAHGNDMFHFFICNTTKNTKCSCEILRKTSKSYHDFERLGTVCYVSSCVHL